MLQLMKTLKQYLDQAGVWYNYAGYGTLQFLIYGSG